MKKSFSTVDQYIGTFPAEVQAILEKVRATIVKAAPEALESISYQMPAYKLYGRPLVYFAAFKNHIGFYALPSGHAEFEEALSGYKKGSGSVQFPLDKEIPYDLIKKIVAFRVKENEWFKK
ncbi:iron chaperone [Flavobacterium sp.]